VTGTPRSYLTQPGSQSLATAPRTRTALALYLYYPTTTTTIRSSLAQLRAASTTAARPSMTSLREESAMSDFGGGHQRNHNEYTYRLPTAPRIVVPPPTLTTEMPGLVVGAAAAGEDGDLSFLQELDLEHIIQKNTLLEWAYERRRQAQMMLPWLYLGPMVAAKDRAFLAREGITMVLAVRAQDNTMTGALHAARDVGADVATSRCPPSTSSLAALPRRPG
jgi:hypothetical protein